jgi:tRNA-specific 2-thiouridylase
MLKTYDLCYPEFMETVFVAMSGGMDSSFAAYFLKQKGYKVVGITFQLLPKAIKNVENPKACCSIESINRAKKIADNLSIPHYVINLRKEFEEHVIENFINEYKSGRTPNPCILCNRYIKFSAFLNMALSIGADKVSTGHYANIKETVEGFFLQKGLDVSKDQSYFLYPIIKETLKHILFPLGLHQKSGLKERTNEIKREYQKVKESQDICFIPGNNYREFISGFAGLREGPVFSVEGKLLGHHDGIHLYTIGQRRGLKIPYKEPLYVVDILAEENTIIAGSKEFLKRKKLLAGDINILQTTSTSGQITGKVRYRQKEESCTYNISGDSLEVEFKNPVYSITPGQSVVLYDDNIVIGGGIIKNSIRETC